MSYYSLILPMASRSFDSLLKEKKQHKKKCLNKHGFPKTNKLICVIGIKDDQVRNFLVDGLGSLGVACIIVGASESYDSDHVSSVPHLKKDDLYAADFFVHDNETKDFDVLRLLSHGIVPIMPEKNTFDTLLKQFNPIAFSGNSFLYGKKDKYTIFASIVGLLENMKFPADYKMLLKNVSESTG